MTIPESTPSPPSSIQLVVTDDHIAAADGQSGVYDKCPAAQAFRALGYLSIDVDDVRVLLTTPDGARIYCKTPRELNLFVDRFDNGESVTPAEFILSEIRLAESKDERKHAASPEAMGLDTYDFDIDIDSDGIDIDLDDDEI